MVSAVSKKVCTQESNHGGEICLFLIVLNKVSTLDTYGDELKSTVTGFEHIKQST